MFMAPGIDDEQHENDEAQGQEHDRTRFGFPKLFEASGDLAEIHFPAIYTRPRKMKMKRRELCRADIPVCR
jgi:hypothetical protein